MGITRKPLSPSEKSKKITKLSPANYDLYLGAAYEARDANLDADDWRTQLHPDSRRRIVNKIVDTLKRHLPFSGLEGLYELEQIASRFEAKIYAAAASQSDYLRKISLKMLSMESKSQNSIPYPAPSNNAGTSSRLPNAG